MNNSSTFTITPINTSHLYRLFILRSLTIVVQISAMAFAVYYLKVQMHLAPILFCVMALTAFNTYVWFRIRRDKAVSHNEIFLHLLIDVAALTFVLFYSGGASNPFITLFLFPIIVSVTILPTKFAWILATLNFACYTFLIFFYHPINIGVEIHTHAPIEGAFRLHILGMWIAFIFSAGFIAFFVMKMGNTIHEQESLLLKAQETALRDQRIIALGSLAASTAHELGTPLGTMNLLVAELKQELNNAPEQVQKDLDLLKQQVGRCKEALSNLSASAGEFHLSKGNAATVDEFLQEILQSWQLMRPEVQVECHWQNDNTGQAKILNDLTLTQAITNILSNAADASPAHVEWHAHWNAKQLIMEINDRGPGLTDEIKQKLGKSPYSEKEKGLGIGLYLTNAIIERFGGEMKFINRENGGLTVGITLPLIDV